MDFGEVNLLAVLVAAVVHQFIGFLWYGPVFGKTWLQASGKTREEISGGPKGAMVFGAIGSLISALSLALILTLPEDPDIGLGIAAGAVAGIGFAAVSIFTTGGYEDRSPTLSGLFSGYQIVGFIVMGAILGAWL